MNEMSPNRPDKFSAYRSRKKAAGLRELRLWVPDVRAPDFWERSKRAAAVRRAASEEEETMQFVEALAADDAGQWD